jgi:hypothetical protein
MAEPPSQVWDNPLGYIPFLVEKLRDCGAPDTADDLYVASVAYQKAPVGDDDEELRIVAMLACEARRLIQKNGGHGYDA